MTPKGLNIKVKPLPAEKIINGIIIPDTAMEPSQEWGVVTDGNDIFDDGIRVLYFGRKCFEKDGEKIVNKLKVLYWE